MIKVSWGKYRSLSGPFTHGDVPVLNEMCAEIRVIAATEGGSWNAVNMYDAGIISVGCLQVIENRLGYVSSLFQEFVKKGVDVNRYLYDSVGIRFNADGRFVLDKSTDPRYVWLLGSDQKSWSSEQTEHATKCCQAMAKTLGLPLAVEAQRNWIRKGFLSRFFFSGDAEQLVREYKDPNACERHQYAAYLCYLSFAVNLPAKAARMLSSYKSATKLPYGSVEWCRGMAQTLGYKSGIDIWPGRFRKIVVTIEQITGVDLADVEQEPEKLGVSIKRVQEILNKLGASLVVDGIYGKMTKRAVKDFQKQFNLKVDGIVGPKTTLALLENEPK